MNKISDTNEQQLAEFIQKNAPQAPSAPWFTKKILNRLPPKKRRIAENVELSTSFVALIITIILGCKFAISTLDASVITFGNLLTYTVYLTIVALLLFNIITPIISRMAQHKSLSAQQQK